MAVNKLKNESDRLENLRSYGILDTPPEKHYQDIVSLAAAICQVPVAFVSLIDSDRQWFKANVGLNELSQTPRDISFCSHAIEVDEIFIVEDALEDDRFKHNPAVTGNPFIRFYAGAQIKTPEGYNVGTLCVVNQKPGSLTQQQKDALKILASQIAELLVLRKLNQELIDSKKMLEEQQELLINKARHQTIGELAGGVCHQINNPLAIIVGRSMILRTLLKQKLPDDGELFKELDVIDQTSQRVSSILKALRTYSRDLGKDISEANIFEIIDDALTIMKGKLAGSQINVTYEKGDEILIKLNRNQMGQIILDLISNSVEAMEESMVKNLDISVFDNGHEILINVSDSGPGISHEDVEKVFAPFFTTKGRHFGVGLTNARSYIKQHRGEILVKSEQGPTTIQVKLPKSA